MELFSEQMYGNVAQGEVGISHEIVAENPQAIDGLATAQQVMFTFSAQGKTLKALALVYIPNNRKAKAPVFVGYNFQGNHSVTKDDWVLYSPYFENNVNIFLGNFNPKIILIKISPFRVSKKPVIVKGKNILNNL